MEADAQELSTLRDTLHETKAQCAIAEAKLAAHALWPPMAPLPPSHIQQMDPPKPQTADIPTQTDAQPVCGVPACLSSLNSKP